MDKSIEAYRLDNGEQINEGDIIIDFRGDKWVFVSVIPEVHGFKVLAHKEGKENSGRLFFASVFGLEAR